MKKKRWRKGNIGEQNNRVQSGGGGGGSSREREGKEMGIKGMKEDK